MGKQIKCGTGDCQQLRMLVEKVSKIVKNVKDFCLSLNRTVL